MKQSELIKTIDRLKRETFETSISQKAYTEGAFDALNRIKHELCTLEEAEREEAVLLNWLGEEAGKITLPKENRDVSFKIFIKAPEKQVLNDNFVLGQNGELYCKNEDGLLVHIPKVGVYRIEICTKEQGTLYKFTY